jgi:putative iron-regulated protein
MHRVFQLLMIIASCALAGTFATPAASQNLQRSALLGAAASGRPRDIGAKRQIASYGELAYRTYQDAYRTALQLQRAIDELIAKPNVASLARARATWLAARPSYGRSEAFRFYGGPIDGGKGDDRGSAPVGLEGLINAWPLDEAYIDYVEGSPEAGIINSGAEAITRASLAAKNARDDEADVTTGYHAIEFLLWGQDVDPNGPGNRSVGDFIGEGRAQRRRTYLKVATDMLVDQLKMLVDAWAPGQDNYRALMLHVDPATTLKNIMTGIATLSGFELASERIGTALDSGSQEDEQSCFSDATHLDIIANVIGIENVYFGRYGSWHGAGIDELVRKANADLARYLERRIRTTAALAQQLDAPFDRTLRTPLGSPERAKVEALVTSLQVQADLLKQAASALGVPIVLGDD